MRTLALAALLAGLAGLAVAIAGSDPAIGARVDAEAKRWTRTRFSHLTSEVWRYGQPFRRRDLTPVANNQPWPEPVPHRDRPERLALDAAGTRLYVTLAGTEAEPGRELAVVDLVTGQVRPRIRVGLRPYRAVLHPDGRHLLVTNELSNYISVVDTGRDVVVGEIPADFYCQGIAIRPDGRRAWVANRYLDQVLVLDLEPGPGGLTGRVREVGGFDERVFEDELDAVLRARCGRCHAEETGGYVAGPDPIANFLSAVENSVGGRPDESPLVRAVTSRLDGGFGDERRTPEYHAGGVLFAPGEESLERLVDWIRRAEGGPGIRVGNEGSHPKDIVLAPDGRHLFVGNTGTMDVSIVDVAARREVGGIYIQNVAAHVTVVRDWLVVLTMGVGFGAAKARDPHGAETWDREHPAAQFTVLRDPKTTDPHPLDRQAVMGPFDAVDGTWNFKMRDIQSDVVLVELDRLSIPAARPGAPLDYLLRAAAYESHPGWVRYTSDTAEATTGDVKGDIPPELQRVHGAFFEWAAVDGDALFTTMAGTFELVEWRAHRDATDPAARLEPVRVYETGLRPIGVVVGRVGTPSAGKLYVANQLDETVSIIDRATGDRRDVIVGDQRRPPLDTDAEKGELIAHTTVFSSDGDTSCLHCHYRDTGDGRGWGAGETIGQDRDGHFTPGGTLGIPQMRNLFAIQPFYFEGTHRLGEGQGADINEPASSIDFDRPVWAGDFTAIESPVPPEARRPQHEEFKERVEIRKLGAAGYDLDERRNAFVRHQSMRYFGAAYDLADLYRFMSAWMGNTTHLLPNPYDAEHPAVQRGERLFNDARVMCGVCHAAPEFTNKSEILTHNDRRALPPLTTITRRDASYTLAGVRAVERANGRDDLDLDPDDAGRVEDREGSFTTMQLRGIFDRPPVFLHHGRARSLREVLCTPDHPARRHYRYPVLLGPEEVRPDRMEIGFNESTRRTPEGPLDALDRVPDTHGGTSHLTPRQLDDLTDFMRSIE